MTPSITIKSLVGTTLIGNLADHRTVTQTPEEIEALYKACEHDIPLGDSFFSRTPNHPPRGKRHSGKVTRWLKRMADRNAARFFSGIGNRAGSLFEFINRRGVS